MDHQEAGRFEMTIDSTIKIVLFLSWPASIYCQSNSLQFSDANGTASLLSSGDLNQTKTLPARTSQTDTIRKASDDLRNGEECARVGAAKLLG